MQILETDLILNSDGSIYHLGLLPHQIAPTIITVGDPARVSEISKHFDAITHRVQTREFVTHTGHIQQKPLTVLSTGMGTDNIDIALTELDALVNVDFKTRCLKSEKNQLTIIRVGTSGAIQDAIPVDSFLVSKNALSFDTLFKWYKTPQFYTHKLPSLEGVTPALTTPDSTLLNVFSKTQFIKGITATMPGFYGPQARRVHLKSTLSISKLSTYMVENEPLSNIEMETSGIYGLSNLLGHRALSVSAILANRCTGVFSKHAQRTVSNLIENVLNTLLSSNILK